MGSWYNWLSALWPIAATITPVLLAVGLLWLRTKFADIAALAATQKDVSDLQANFKVMEVKLKGLEDAHDEEPTRAQVVAKISDVVERLSRMEAGIEGVNRTLRTQGDYIQALTMSEQRR